jgi:hypothetical protein
MMERWNIGMLGLKSIALKNMTLHGETVVIYPQNLNPNAEVMDF